MKPGTLMGEYGDEARYALAPDQATRCEIARPPADVLSGRPMISSNETVRKYVERSLDLTMKGGTTSGVVYPLAICELATDFRFRNVGGTSAGAIVAALTAAAELGRSGQVLASCQSSHKESPQEEMPAAENFASSGTAQERHAIRPGFTGLADIISWLTQIRTRRSEGRGVPARPAFPAWTCHRSDVPRSCRDHAWQTLVTAAACPVRVRMGHPSASGRSHPRCRGPDGLAGDAVYRGNLLGVRDRRVRRTGRTRHCPLRQRSGSGDSEHPIRAGGSAPYSREARTR